ncbi:MAG TPA: hypothetical protein VF174_15830 [Micromonosporaceae bacterium]
MPKIIAALMVAGTLLMGFGVVAEIAEAPEPRTTSTRSPLLAEDWLLDWAIRIRREIPPG